MSLGIDQQVLLNFWVYKNHHFSGLISCPFHIHHFSGYIVDDCHLGIAVRKP